LLKYDRFSRRTAAQIGARLGYDKDKQETVAYGLTVLLNNLSGLVLVLLFACLLKVFSATAALAAALLLLRPAAGGAHCSSSFNCSLFGYIFIPLLGLAASRLAAAPGEIRLICISAAFMVALGGIIKSAPYFTREKPRAWNRRKQLKGRAIFIAVLVFGFSIGLSLWGHAAWSMGLGAGLLFQGLMLLPAGISFVRGFDFLVDAIALKLGGESR
jgi:accessory gene regulator protein AgrB